MQLDGRPEQCKKLSLSSTGMYGKCLMLYTSNSNDQPAPTSHRNLNKYELMTGPCDKYRTSSPGGFNIDRAVMTGNITD